MKRTQIKRKTPMPRSSLPMKRSRIAPVSNKRAAENRDYSVARREYLAEHPYCELCVPIKAYPHDPPLFEIRPQLANQIHHYRGRVGRLLTDKRFFRAACQDCHEWVGKNGAQARRIGVLAPIPEFNVYPEDK